MEALNLHCDHHAFSKGEARQRINKHYKRAQDQRNAGDTVALHLTISSCEMLGFTMLGSHIPLLPDTTFKNTRQTLRPFYFNKELTITKGTRLAVQLSRQEEYPDSSRPSGFPHFLSGGRQVANLTAHLVGAHKIQ